MVFVKKNCYIIIIGVLFFMFFYSEKIDLMLNAKVINSHLYYPGNNLLFVYLSTLKTSFRRIFLKSCIINKNGKIVFFPRKSNFLFNDELSDYEKYSFNDFTVSIQSFFKISFLGGWLLIKSLFFRRKKEMIKKSFKGFLLAKLIFWEVNNFHPSQCYFYGFGYKVITFFLATFLQNNKINNSIFINNLVISASSVLSIDEVIVTNKWSAKAIVNTNLISYKSIIIANDFNYNNFKENKLFKKKIAIYSSGIYMRKKGFIHDNVYNQMLENEIRLFEIVKLYAMNKKELSFTIFIHPNVENFNEAITHYSDLLSYPNISLQPKNVSSCDTFGLYEIGISNVSTTLIDRLTQGYKSVFVFPGNFSNDLKNLGLGFIVVDKECDNIDTLERLRLMNRTDYFNIIE